ncbi:MCE family protein [Gordonia sp. DT30]
MGRPQVRHLRLILLVATVTIVASACSFNGINSLPVPGAQGTSRDSYQISAVIPSATGLVNNAPVLIDDATVGSVGSITVAPGWNAKVVIRLNPGVKVAKGSHVMVGMTSVLGSTHLEIVEPAPGDQGDLAPGDQIPLPHCPKADNIDQPTSNPVPDINSAQQVPGCNYPSTEQVLSALSVVLNGGGLSQFGDIVHEMSQIFAGRDQQIRALIPRLTTLVGDLNRQRDNIIHATEGLDRLSLAVNQQTPTLQKALRDGPEILKLLNDQRQQFVNALDSVGRLSATTNDVLDANSQDIKTIVSNMAKAFQGLAAAGPALPGSLRLLLTFPFLEEEIPTMVKGDYINSDLVLDLTIPKLQRSILRSVGVVGPEGITGRPAGAAGRGLNPFTSPLQPGGETRSENAAPIPATQNPPRSQGGGH